MAQALVDGYRVIRLLHANHRSHVYLARDEATDELMALKFPSQDLAAQPPLLQQFLYEEWIANRASRSHLLQAYDSGRERSSLYLAMAFVDGLTLRQWMHDRPPPDLSAVRGIIAQVCEGARALHRKGMIHRDIRPENIMIDADGTVTLIDLGSVRVVGLSDRAIDSAGAMGGTHQYTAPECLIGEIADRQSDLFSIGVVAHELLSGTLPYGAQAGRVRNRRHQRALRYRPLTAERADVPSWVDGALATAVHPEPARRYRALSEFVADLHQPNPRFADLRGRPLAERDPIRFWQYVSALFFVVLIVLVFHINQR